MVEGWIADGVNGWTADRVDGCITGKVNNEQMYIHSTVGSLWEEKNCPFNFYILIAWRYV